MAIDPDSEVICAAEVSAATNGDAVVASTLLGDLAAGADERSIGQAARAVVYGDGAYGTGAHVGWLDHYGLIPMAKSQVATAPGGGSKDHPLRHHGGRRACVRGLSAWPRIPGC